MLAIGFLLLTTTAYCVNDRFRKGYFDSYCCNDRFRKVHIDTITIVASDRQLIAIGSYRKAMEILPIVQGKCNFAPVCVYVDGNHWKR